MKKDFYFCDYIVVFIDILGQKEAFKDIKDLPINEEEKAKLIQAFSQTAAFVEKFRGWFEDYFNEYTKERESQLKVPESKKQQFDEMRKVVLKYKSFSDCIQAFVPLQSDKYLLTRLNGVFGILGACGTMLVYSLAQNKAFRVGIDIGVGTE